MKKLIAMLLSLVMILSLFAGCGNDKPAASEAPKAARNPRQRTPRTPRSSLL